MPAPPDNLQPSTLALFLDVDGTLLDIEDHPAGVQATPSLVELLARLSVGLNGALSLISGRPVAACFASSSRFVIEAEATL